jgi:hypothetical protein
LCLIVFLGILYLYANIDFTLIKKTGLFFFQILDRSIDRLRKLTGGIMQ